MLVNLFWGTVRFVGAIFLMSGIGLVIYQTYLWFQYGTWPEWPLSYLFIDPTLHIVDTSTSEQQINASLSILKLTPSYFYEYFNNSWLLNPKTLYGLHELTVNFLGFISIPALLIITGIILTSIFLE